jgi:hypothetical protein
MFGAHPMFRIGGGQGYQITNSLRFRASNSAHLTRTPASGGSQTTYTFSYWMKRGALGAQQTHFSVATNSQNYFVLGFGFINNNDQLDFLYAESNVITARKQTSRVFRDPSAWYHVVAVLDTTNATAADRLRIYINGVRETSFSASTDPTQNTNQHGWNTAVANYIGVAKPTYALYHDGYLANVYFIDGQALTPSSFGQTDATTGVWLPKTYSGTYGTNGFFLEFKDAASTTTIGNDTSGNSNNFTTSGISVTSGVTFDQMTDTPTNNYCVLNPLAPSAANISWANLRSGTTAVRGSVNALLANSYWEVTAGGSAVTAGTISDAAVTNTTTVTANKVFGFRLTSAGTLDYINITDAGAWTNITSGLSGQQFPYGITAAADWNFGQRAFVGTVPSSYYALSTASPISAAVTLSGSFTGNAAADGPFVWTNGNPATLTINGNGVTFGTDADKTAGGFKLRTSSAGYNASGSNSWTATAGKRFVQLQKPNNAQVNP